MCPSTSPSSRAEGPWNLVKVFRHISGSARHFWHPAAALRMFCSRPYVLEVFRICPSVSHEVMARKAARGPCMVNGNLSAGAPACGLTRPSEVERATGVEHEATTAKELKVNERGLNREQCLDDTGSVEDELIVVVRPKHVSLHVGYQSSRLSPTSRQNKQPEGLNTARRP